jgi:ribosomal protein L37E
MTPRRQEVPVQCARCGGPAFAGQVCSNCGWINPGQTKKPAVRTGRMAPVTVVQLLGVLVILAVLFGIGLMLR